jgi:hypothetical protein
MSDKPNYRIIRHYGSLHDLEGRVNAETDYTPTGAPFRDNDAREWCQAVVLKPSAPNVGEIHIREPKKR